MAKEVIKKDGTKVAFDAEKIKNSIAAAAERTDLSEEKKNEITERVANIAIQMAVGKEEITTTEIKEKILSELDNIEPSISKNWREYDQKMNKS